MNRRQWTTLLLLAGATTILVISTAASQPAPKKNAFSTLKAGQAVMLKDKGSAYEISMMDTDTPATHTVVEVGDDYVVVRDLAGATEFRIPIFAVKAVILLKTKPG